MQVLAKTIWSASEFLDSLATESTRASYKTGLKQFFTYVSGENLPSRNYEARLDELSMEYFTGESDFEKDYVSYQNEIKEKYAPKTLELRMLAVRGLFEFNQVEIPKAILTRLNGRKAVEPISEEKVPRKEEVKLILQHLPLHIKTYVLFLLSGGLRPGEPLTLNLDDIDEEDGLTRINLKSSGTKTGRKRWTYVTPEATKSYELWMESRDHFIESTANTLRSEKQRKKYLMDSRHKVFPFTYNTANKVWNTAVRKAGLMERDDETNRVTLRLHNLRKYFSTRGKWSDRDIPDFLQGHIGGVRGVYQRYDQAEKTVREAYLNAVPSLTIEEYADSGKVEELMSKLAENKMQSNQMNENLNYVVNQNKELNEKLRILENELRISKLEHNSKINDVESRLESVLKTISNSWIVPKEPEEIQPWTSEQRKLFKAFLEKYSK